MKRILFLLTFCVISLVAMCQTTPSHLKFMGIPLNGTITTFQGKLIAKGCSLNKAVSNSIAVGCRAFKGTFLSKKVDIYVYYNTSSKIVYRAKAVMSGISEDIADQEYKRIHDLLLTKYNESYEDEGTNEGKPSLSILPRCSYDEDNSVWQNSYGEIDLYITKDDQEFIRYPYNYNLHIDYTDRVNSDKNQAKEMDEL